MYDNRYEYLQKQMDIIRKGKLAFIAGTVTMNQQTTIGRDGSTTKQFFNVIVKEIRYCDMWPKKNEEESPDQADEEGFIKADETNQDVPGFEENPETVDNQEMEGTESIPEENEDSAAEVKEDRSDQDGASVQAETGDGSEEPETPPEPAGNEGTVITDETADDDVIANEESESDEEPEEENEERDQHGYA